MPLRIGEVFEARYTIDALLGQGGFGAVYRARDLRLDVTCAIKESFDASASATRQFKREASILAELKHPNLPRVTDYFDLHGQGLYLVMDFVQGEDLAARLIKNGTWFTQEQVAPWVRQVCEALDYLHCHNPPIIHRDIKPQNIIVTEHNVAILVDFGLAKTHDISKQTSSGAQGLTPGYAPIEQYGQGVTDHRSDIYSLGATIYALLTGEPPPESIQRIINKAGLRSIRSINPTVQPAFEGLVFRALELDPAKRMQKARDLGEFLDKDGTYVGWRNKERQLQTSGLARPAVSSHRQEGDSRWKLLYRSDYYAASQWAEGTFPDYQLKRKDGYYHVAVTRADYYRWTAPSISVANFRVHVDAQFGEKSGPGTSCGVVFRVTDEDHFYLFSISRSGYFQLSLLAGGRWKTLLDWRYSEFIARYGLVNALTVEMTKNRIRMGVNGRALTAVVDDSLPAGWVGLYVATGSDDSFAEARFRDYRLYVLPSADEPAATGHYQERKRAFEEIDAGCGLANLGRNEEALLCFDRALEIEPKNAFAWSNKGWSLGILGRHKEALPCLDRSLEIDPKNAFAWSNKGWSLGILGRHDEALACLDRALEINPENAFAWGNKGWSLGILGRHDEALACLDRALEINRENAFAWSKKGWSLGILGRHDEALQSYEKSLQIDPQNMWCCLNKGIILHALRRDEEALLCYDAVLEKDPTDGLALSSKVDSLRALDRSDEADECAARAYILSRAPSPFFEPPDD